MLREAQEQRQKQREIQKQAERMKLPPEGTLLALIGSLGLFVSFFLPAEQSAGVVIYPFKAILLHDFWFRWLLPLLYSLGITAFLFKLTGRFGYGAPLTIWGMHLSLVVVILLGNGIALHTSLLAPKQEFATSLMSIGLLVWWPLFIQFGLTLLRRADLVWKLTRMTWIAGLVCVLVFSILILDAWYKKDTSVSFGLLVSFASSLTLVWGFIQSEKGIIDPSRYIGILSR